MNRKIRVLRHAPLLALLFAALMILSGCGKVSGVEVSFDTSLYSFPGSILPENYTESDARVSYILPSKWVSGRDYQMGQYNGRRMFISSNIIECTQPDESHDMSRWDIDDFNAVTFPDNARYGADSSFTSDEGYRILRGFYEFSNFHEGNIVTARYFIHDQERNAFTSAMLFFYEDELSGDDSADALKKMLKEYEAYLSTVHIDYAPQPGADTLETVIIDG